MPTLTVSPLAADSDAGADDDASDDAGADDEAELLLSSLLFPHATNTKLAVNASTKLFSQLRLLILPLPNPSMVFSLKPERSVLSTAQPFVNPLYGYLRFGVNIHDIIFEMFL
jgi:hypothetical protein